MIPNFFMMSMKYVKNLVNFAKIVKKIGQPCGEKRLIDVEIRHKT
jgi:hypothetical protein